MQPPVADKRPTTTEHHGRTRTDDYEWLRAKDDPEVTAYLEAENAYTEERTAHLADLRQPIFDEIKARTRETDLSVPTRNRGYWYYGRSFEGKRVRRQLPRPGRRPRRLDSPAARPRTPRPTSRRCPARRCCSTSTRSPRATSSSPSAARAISPDGRLLAYATDVVGDERYTVRVKDLAHRRAARRRDRPASSAAPPGTAPASTSTTRPSTTPGAPTRSGGTASAPTQADDELVYHETDGRFWVGVGRTRSRPLPGDRRPARKTTSEYHFLDADRPRRAAAEVLRRARGGRRVLPRPRRDRRRGRVPGAAQRHRRRLRARPSRPIAPTPRGAVGAADRPRPRRTPRGRRRLRRPPRGPPAQRGPDPAADPRARRRTASADDYLVEFDHEIYTVGSGGNPSFDQPTVRLGYTTHGRAVVGLRLRRPHPRADPAASGRRCSAATTRPTTRSTGSGRPPTTASRCRSRSWSPRREARRRHRPGADAALRVRRLRDLDRPVLLDRPARRCSTAARRSRSPTCAAAARWAGTGTTTASCCTSSTRSPTSSPAPGTSSTTGWTTRRPAGRRGRQRRRPADGRGRQPGARRVRRASSPGCRSSTPSPRCSTRRCR